MKDEKTCNKQNMKVMKKTNILFLIPQKCLTFAKSVCEKNQTNLFEIENYTLI